MHNPKAKGRLIKLTVELVEFDIRYKPRVAIKAQALADFLVECTTDNQEVGGHEDKVVEPKEDAKPKKYWLLFLTENQKQKLVVQGWCSKALMGSYLNILSS